MQQQDPDLTVLHRVQHLGAGQAIDLAFATASDIVCRDVHGVDVIVFTIQAIENTRQRLFRKQRMLMKVVVELQWDHAEVRLLCAVPAYYHLIVHDVGPIRATSGACGARATGAPCRSQRLRWLADSDATSAVVPGTDDRTTPSRIAASN